MGVFQSFFDIFKKNSEIESSYDFDALIDEYHTLYLKHLAVDTCAEFLARSFGRSEFRIRKNGEPLKNEWTYLLNVRPNLDQSASSFWQQVVYKLITQNEVLIVLSDDDQLLIAESYVRKEYALYEDYFESVWLKGYEFKRKFPMSEVIFLQYNNNDLSRYVRGLYEDYASLYNRMVEVAMRNHQIRATVTGKEGRGFDDKLQKRAQSYIDKVYAKFSKESIAIVPVQAGLEYNELTNTVGETNQSIDELKKLKRQFVDEVADILGIPSTILHGELADLESAQTVLNKYCLKSLNKKIEDELNAKIIDKTEFVNGTEIKVVGVDKKDIFDLADAVDKLISSGGFNRNEIRKEVDYESIDGGDEFYITKNYEKAAKGGEEVNDETGN
ncbi:phage portal protein, HK97 family [Enterococcus malodoratus]|uniref:phage portal protein n=1 Tax=Enterococcus malodoratus TaxID=71451 RepID=UPI0008CC4CF1|nr:phage portal protein [Enterococcus malodoratus]SET96376.1 phage portal protein, HK97 family [Enterococcus malodoratus]